MHNTANSTNSELQTYKVNVVTVNVKPQHGLFHCSWLVQLSRH